ncbi:hypothetical protein DFH06DRAFT_1125389 [Mycena polygramma]|nr:hypothetical protein DFH06DRAFT_1125389 [Mycena polygramma]
MHLPLRFAWRIAAALRQLPALMCDEGKGWGERLGEEELGEGNGINGRSKRDEEEEQWGEADKDRQTNPRLPVLVTPALGFEPKHALCRAAADVTVEEENEKRAGGGVCGRKRRGEVRQCQSYTRGEQDGVGSVGGEQEGSKKGAENKGKSSSTTAAVRKKKKRHWMRRRPSEYTRGTTGLVLWSGGSGEEVCDKDEEAAGESARSARVILLSGLGPSGLVSG